MRRNTAVIGLTTVALATLTALPAQAHPKAPPDQKQAVAVGYGGAVSSVDLDASRSGVEVLRRGGNAIDAAVATAATLGVTEPFVAAIGGGGYLTYYDARTHKVYTFDGRETGPAKMTKDIFIDPKTGKPLSFDEAVTSGLSVGVPGTLATWDAALRRFGTRKLSALLQPAIKVAEHGFTVDQEFYDQDQVNAARFKDIVPTRDLFLPGGQPPAVGSTFRNPDLAGTYREIARNGLGWFYGGELGKEIAYTVEHPPVDPAATRNVRPGVVQQSDLGRYKVIPRDPTHVDYRGLDVYGMAPSSSGGSTVGEALNIMKQFTLTDPVQALQVYLEASKLAYADRGAYVGDPAYVNVPLKTLLSDRFARSRACLVSTNTSLTTPVAPGDLNGEGCSAPSGAGERLPYEGPQTTHLVTSDKWGDVVSYTLTIEQFGGSALTVPHRGFLLNNEMTDFNFTSSTPPGQQHVADDRAEERPPTVRGRLPGRLDDHHDGVADPAEPRRPGHEPAGRDLGAARHAAEHPADLRRAGVHRPVRRGADGQGSESRAVPRPARGRDRVGDRAGIPGRREGRGRRGEDPASRRQRARRDPRSLNEVTRSWR
jgi:gamma-glutamyltranspeptidase/glutathione hydrolase